MNHYEDDFGRVVSNTENVIATDREVREARDRAYGMLTVLSLLNNELKKEAPLRFNIDSMLAQINCLSEK